MPPLYIGNQKVDACYIGSNKVDKGMIGVDEVCGGEIMTFTDLKTSEIFSRTHTFSAVDLSSPSSDRHIMVAIVCIQASFTNRGNHPKVTSVSINGNNGTVTSVHHSKNFCNGLSVIHYPTNTTGTITVQTSMNVYCAISVFALSGQQSNNPQLGEEISYSKSPEPLIITGKTSFPPKGACGGIQFGTHSPTEINKRGEMRHMDFRGYDLLGYKITEKDLTTADKNLFSIIVVNHLKGTYLGACGIWH